MNDEAAPPGVRRARPRSTADLLDVVLGEQVDALLALEPAVREDAPDAVHAMRVATRRLRSLLATYRPVLDTGRTEAVRAELKWLGGVLGTPRDAEVARDRVLAALDALPPDEVVDVPRDWTANVLGARHVRAHRAALDALASARYRDLSAALGELRTNPPFAAASADDKAKPMVRERVAHDARRVDRAARDAGSSVALHEVRKAAKRARYAAESAELVAGKDARRLARRMEALQDVLGEYQDAIAARALVRDLSVAATSAGRNAHAFGVLDTVEAGRAADARGSAAKALRRAQSRKARAWLT